MKEKKNTDARIQANNKYNAKAYDRINIAVPKGRKATIEALATERGESINGLINHLLQREAGMSVEEWKTAEIRDEKQSRE